MFGIGSVELAIGLVVIFVLEIALFWAASALADVPPLDWSRLILVVSVVTVLSVASTGALAHYSGAWNAPLDPENRTVALVTAGLALVVLWAVPAILYPLLVSVSIPRAMWAALLQLLLRAFLYVFLVAVVMVALAVYQIYSGTDVRTDRLDVPPHRADLSARP